VDADRDPTGECAFRTDGGKNTSRVSRKKRRLRDIDDDWAAARTGGRGECRGIKSRQHRHHDPQPAKESLLAKRIDSFELSGSLPSKEKKKGGGHSRGREKRRRSSVRFTETAVNSVTAKPNQAEGGGNAGLSSRKGGGRMEGPAWGRNARTDSTNSRGSPGKDPPCPREKKEEGSCRRAGPRTPFDEPRQGGGKRRRSVWALSEERGTAWPADGRLGGPCQHWEGRSPPKGKKDDLASLRKGTSLCYSASLSTYP